jgi:hypothetical protein
VVVVMVVIEFVMCYLKNCIYCFVSHHNLTIFKRQSFAESYYQKFQARVLCFVSTYFKRVCVCV